MEDKNKSKLKEALKAAGVAGAGAAVGAEVLDPWKTFDTLDGLGQTDSPLSEQMIDMLYGYNRLYGKIKENPNLGVGLNAAASGLGALAAYGVLKGVTKGVRKAIHNRDEKKLELARAYGEAAKSGRA